MIKKVVYSHWTKPSDGKFVGFNSEQAFVACTYLSVMYSLKWAEKVELVTDQAGYELLVEKYNIPYTHVVVGLDNLNHISKLHWSIGKMYACAIQEEPFMHQDNDVVWFKKPPRRILMARASFQNIERDEQAHRFYRCMMNHADKYFEKKKPFVDYGKIYAVNCGIMGFNDLSVIDDWYDHALEYIDYYDKHKAHEAGCEVLSPIIFEQLHLHYFLTHYKVPYEVLSPSSPDWVAEDAAKRLGYTHLIAHSKRNANVEARVLERIQEEFPDFYSKLTQ